MVSQIQIFCQLILATLLGGAVGIEREVGRKEAGLRTYSLVSLGAAFFTIIAFGILSKFHGLIGVKADPLRIIQAIAIGIGFIGAGLIIFRKNHIEGLTTAAGLWVAAAIGVAVGAGYYIAAIFTSLLMIGILAGFRLIEERILRSKP